MRTFVGTKIIQAEEMTRLDFLVGEKKVESGPPSQEDQPGYRVVYPDGYVSWSPAEVFEEAYREINLSEKEMVTNG